MTNAVRIPQFLSLCALLLFVAMSSVWALGPGQPMSSYLRTRFTNDDGLSSNIVSNLVQSRDGFLWLDTVGDLTRFDGRHFTTFDGFSRVTTLAMAPDGDLWVGTTNGLEQIPAAALNQFGRLPATSYHPPGKSGYITCLHFTRNGVLLVGTATGLYRLEHHAFSLVLPGPAQIHRIEEAANGHLWVTTSGGVAELVGAQVVPHPEFASELGVKASDVFHVFEDSRGIVWLCTANGIARRMGGSMEKLAPWGPHGHGVHRAYEGPGGAVWFAGAEGLFRATAAGLELTVPGMKVRSIYGDRDGNLWVGTNGDGLFRFKNRAARMFTTADGLPNNIAMTVLQTHDGALWSGFNCGGISRFDGHGFHSYNEKDGLLNSCVNSLAEDANHDLWIATYGGGVFRFHDGRFKQYSRAQGLSGDVVNGVVTARDGSVWLATGAGVNRLRDGKISRYIISD